MDLQKRVWRDVYEIEHLTDDLSCKGKREEILRSLEEEFQKGLQEVQRAKEEKASACEKQEKIFHSLHIPQKGSDRWEKVRRSAIHTVPLSSGESFKDVPVSRSHAYKISMKEDLLYFNVASGHLCTVTAGGVLKIYSVSATCVLKKLWESANSLFAFLVRSEALTWCAKDVLSQVLMQLHARKIKNAEKVFQEFIMYVHPSSVKKAFFVNGYLVFVRAFGDMSVFDETLREIPLGVNRKRLIASILKEPWEKKAQTNLSLSPSKERKISLVYLTIKVSSSSVKLICPNKSIYEEIHFENSTQAVYRNSVLFLYENMCIHAIVLK